jgi:DNA (cytosine-5)-methyltransferase 1
MNVFDSFAGAGGLSLGFQQAGFNIIAASEYDDWACDTFERNHKGANVIRGDIRKISDKMILSSTKGAKIHVLLGGPPCQGFSVANKKNGDPKDPRNSLFTEFIRLAKLLNPNIVIMENVPNIVNAKTGDGTKVIDIIEEELKKLGYTTYRKVLQATDYGVPQIRKRFLIVGSKVDLEKPFPDPTHSVDGGIKGLLKSPTLWEAISDLPSLEAGESSSSYKDKPQNEFQRRMRENSETLHNHTAMRHTKRLVDRFKSMNWGQKGDELEEKHMPLKRNGNGQRSAKGYSQNNRRMFPDKACHTITASFYANFVHPYNHRNFSPREGARVQTFPDDFVFLGKPTTPSHSLLRKEGREDDIHLCQYNQIGNAVPPMMAKAIALNILDN